MDAGSLLILLSAEAAAQFDDITRTNDVNKLKGQTANDWPNSFRSSRLIPAVEYIRAQRARTLLMRNMEKLMADWDVLVSPSFTASLSITNLTGHPQICVPCGFINDLPQAILFTGRLYEEGKPVRVAMEYQHRTKWRDRRPKLEG